MQTAWERKEHAGLQTNTENVCVPNFRLRRSHGCAAPPCPPVPARRKNRRLARPVHPMHPDLLQGAYLGDSKSIWIEFVLPQCPILVNKRPWAASMCPGGPLLASRHAPRRRPKQTSLCGCLSHPPNGHPPATDLTFQCGTKHLLHRHKRAPPV